MNFLQILSLMVSVVYSFGCLPMHFAPWQTYLFSGLLLGQSLLCIPFGYHLYQLRASKYFLCSCSHLWRTDIIENGTNIYDLAIIAWTNDL
jgi:hypothetical protein